MASFLFSSRSVCGARLSCVLDGWTALEVGNWSASMQACVACGLPGRGPIEFAALRAALCCYFYPGMPYDRLGLVGSPSIWSRAGSVWMAALGHARPGLQGVGLSRPSRPSRPELLSRGESWPGVHPIGEVGEGYGKVAGWRGRQTKL